MPPGYRLAVSKDDRIGGWVLLCPEALYGEHFSPATLAAVALRVAVAAWDAFGAARKVSRASEVGGR